MSLSKSLSLFLKGMAMGAADVVPGVSGGTIALITGIYTELLDAISQFSSRLIPAIRKGGIVKAAKALPWKFLITLFAGIATSVLTLAKLISYLLQTYPILLWSFFLGLIIGSILLIGKKIKLSVSLSVAVGIIGFLAALGVGNLPAQESNEQLYYFFISGVIAICAMILPGISGSFILVILGSYEPILNAVHERNIKIIAVVGAGAIVGLLSFSRVLKWLFSRYPNGMLALMTGFITGSIPAVWPWKNSANKPIYFPEFTAENQLIPAFLFVLVGFGLILGLDKWSEKIKRFN
ncbi:MAG: DUF368 domain-containing protein [Bacteroidetes bacterium]|nr:DUF368 domain-containing protein [Bacteroidota bacterium]